ncbi:MAG: hypothetical protein Ct9H300mP11_09110 [Chloroflexota bacterium]|nr:MAG: hypothetical protein Ct9H300mP11_09110 [Chloroflexota bacterium]
MAGTSLDLISDTSLVFAANPSFKRFITSGVMLSHIWGGAARCSWGFLQTQPEGQRTEGAYPRVIYRYSVPFFQHCGVIHSLYAITIWLSSDIAVLEINFHPLVGGLFQLLFQHPPGAIALGFSQRLRGRGTALNRSSSSRCPKPRLWGVLECGGLFGCRAVPKAPSLVLTGIYPIVENPSGSTGSPRKPFWVPAPELHVHQASVADIKVVGGGQTLNYTSLNPLPTSA